MNDKVKIRYLEQQVQRLQDEIADRSKSTTCTVLRVTFKQAVKGFEYPHAVKNIWVDWRDNSLLMIVPKQKKSETVKSQDGEQKA